MQIATEHQSDAEILTAKARLPEHVVYRTFVKETVVLNLKTGRYHGLNPTAGRMLDVIHRVPNVRGAAEKLATEYDLTVEEMEQDLTGFCRDLLGRGLIELVADERQ